MAFRLALHTWSLDTTPLADALQVVAHTGWDGVELRRVDFVRAAEAGLSADQVIEMVKASGLPVACVGLEAGWMFARGGERARLLQVVAEQCERAARLGCDIVMSPADRTAGDLAEAAASVREVGDVVARHGLRLALEFNSQAAQLNRLSHAREVLKRAGHPRCGLLLDTYHLGRTGTTLAELEDLRAAEIVYVQYSDVPATGLEPGHALDRLPPGQGTVPFKAIFGLLATKGYTGWLSYEAPNPAAWARPAGEVAREALAATRAVLPWSAP